MFVSKDLFKRNILVLKKPFYNAYAKLKADDFFKINNKNTDSLLFIDRMNLKAKLGTQVDINFNDIEQDFMTKAQNTETFDEVFKLSEEIYEYCEQELEDKKKEILMTCNSILQICLKKAK